MSNIFTHWAKKTFDPVAHMNVHRGLGKGGKSPGVRVKHDRPREEWDEEEAAYHAYRAELAGRAAIEELVEWVKQYGDSEGFGARVIHL